MRTPSVASRPVLAVTGFVTRGGTLAAHVRFADDPAHVYLVTRDSLGVWRTHDT